MTPAVEGQEDPAPIDQDTAASWDTYGPRRRKRPTDPRFRPAEEDCE